MAKILQGEIDLIPAQFPAFLSFHHSRMITVQVYTASSALVPHPKLRKERLLSFLSSLRPREHNFHHPKVKIAQRFHRSCCYLLFHQNQSGAVLLYSKIFLEVGDYDLPQVHVFRCSK